MARDFEILNAKLNIEVAGVDKATKDIKELGKEVNNAFDSIDLGKLGKSNITQSFKQVEDGLKRLTAAGKEASGLQKELSFLKSISFQTVTTESGKAKTALVDMMSGTSKAAQSARADVRAMLQDMAKDINSLGTGTNRLDSTVSTLQKTRDTIAQIQKEFNKPIKMDLFNLDNVLKAQETPIGNTVTSIATNIQDKFKTSFKNVADDIKLFGDIFKKNYNSTIEKSVADPVALSKPIKELIAEVTSVIRTLPDKTNPSTIKITDDFNKLKNEFLTASFQLKHFYEVLNSAPADSKAASYAKSRIDELEVKVKSTEKSIRDMSGSIEEFAKVSQSAQVADLVNKFNDINNTVTIAGRGVTGFINDIKLSADIAAGGGSKWFALQNALFGTNEVGGFLGKTFAYLTKGTDDLGSASTRLEKAALKTSNEMSQLGLKSNSLVKILKDVASAEGLTDKADFGSLDAQVQQVTNEYQRLYRIILSGGKPTQDELQRIKVETQGLQQTVIQLVKSGIIPANSETATLLKTMSTDLLGKGGNSIKQLTQIIKAMSAEEEKAKQKAQEFGDTSDKSAKRSLFGWLNFFNLFKKGPTDIKAAKDAIDTVGESTKRTSGLLEGMKAIFTGLGAGAVIGGFATLIPFDFDLIKTKVTGAIQAASDAAEEMSKFSVVFDSTTDSAKGFDDSLVQGVMATLDSMAGTLGRSKYELKELAATFQDTFVPLGFGREEAAKLSIGVTELTEDLSSFYNLSEKEVGDSLSSFFVGNYENARKFGSVITDARLDTELMKMGVEGGTEAVDLQTKALVALRLLYNDTSDAQGDAARTAMGFANQMRTLQGQAKDVAIEFGQRLLPFANLLLSAFLRFTNEIGPSIANIFNGATAAITPFVNSLSTILSGGSIDEIFTSLQIAAGNGIVGMMDSLNSFIPFAADWAWSWGTEIYNGLIDMANTLLVEAMNYIGSIFSDFLQPGSPPREGPLSTIDEWGSGLMNTFNSSISNDSAAGLQEKLTAATTNVLDLRQQIIDAERSGYVPPELKEKLKLAEEEKAAIEAQINDQKNLNKEQTKGVKIAQAASGGAGGGAGSGAAGSRDRVTAERRTALEIRNTAMSVLEQQLKDGTIKYEDYVKEKLKIENKFYEDSLQAGDAVNQDTINNIRDLQAEVDKITAKAPKEKIVRGGIGLGNLGLTVDDFLPKPIEIQKSVSEAVTKIANTAVTTFSTKVKESGTKLQTSLVEIVSKGFSKIREYVKSLAPEQIFPFTVIAGFLASPLVSGVSALFSSIGSAAGSAVSAIGGLGAVLQILLKYVFKFSVYGLIIYGIFVNWDEIVKDVTFIWESLKTTIKTSIKNITDFISAFKKAKGSDTIISNLVGGFSLLALTATNILGLIKKVVKIALIGGIVGGFTIALNAINDFTSKFFTSFGGVDKFTQDLVTTLSLLSKAFKDVSSNIFLASDALFRGDFQTSLNYLTGIPDIIKRVFASGEVSKFFTDLGTSIRAALPPSVIAFFDMVGQKISGVLQPTFDALQPVLVQFGIIWERLQTTFTRLGPLLLKVGAIIGGIIVVALGLVVDVILSVLQTLPDIAPFFVRAFGGVAMIITGIIDVFNSLVLAINAGWALIQGDTTTAGNLISQAFLSIQEGITELFGGLYTTVINLGAGILVAVESFALNFITNILRVLGMEQYASYFEGIKTGFVNLLNGLAQDATNIISGLVDQITQIFTLLYNKLIGHSIIPDMITGILNSFSLFDTDLGKLVSATVENVLGFFINLGDKIVSNITTSLSNAGGTISSLISGLFSGSGGTAEQATPQPTAVDTSGAATVSTTISQLVPIVTNSTLVLQNLLNNFISGTLELLNGVGNTITATFLTTQEILVGENSILVAISDSVIAIITNMAVGVVSQLKIMANDGATALTSSKWSDVGKYLVLGIIKGINDNRSAFIEKVKHLAQEAISAAEEELGISSPSIAFREIGAQVVDGFSIGVATLPDVIGGSIGMARDVAEKQLKSVLDPVKIKPILSTATANFRKYFDQIKAIYNSNLNKIEKGKQISKILMQNIDLGALGIHGGVQGAAVSSAINRLVSETFANIPDLIEQSKNQARAGLEAISNQMEEISTRFRTSTENVRYQTNSTRNAIEDAFDTPITDAKLFDLFTQVQNGVDFGGDLNDKIKLAYLSQNKLNGALEDQLKVEEQIQQIGEAQAELDRIVPPPPPEIPVSDLEAGLELLDALNLGLDATVPDVLLTLSNLSTDMIEQLRQNLQISSPSKVLMKIGNNVGEGLKLGIINSTKNISQLGTTAVNNLQNSINSAIINPNSNGLVLDTGAANSQNMVININNKIDNKMDLAYVEQKILNTIKREIKK